MQQRIKLKNDELERQRRKVEAHSEQLDQTQSAIDDERAAVGKLDKQVCYALMIIIANAPHPQVHDTTEAMAAASDQLREVDQKLAEIGVDEHEGHREQRKKALVDNLKRIFPDRVVRLIERF